MRRFSLLIALCATGLFLSPLIAQNAADPKSAAQAPKDAPKDGKRTPEQIQGDLEKAGGELRGILTGPEVMLDPAKRKEAGPKAIPVIKRMVAALEEIAQVQPEAKAQIAEAKMEFSIILAIFGDADSITALETAAKGKDAQAVDAQGALQLLAYWKDPKDEAAQLKVLDEVQKLAKANPKSDALGQTVMKMAQMGAASKAVTAKAENILTTDLTGEFATQVGAQIKGAKKMKDGVGKPIDIAGAKLDGTAFSTSKDMKGKVILVDFWATWCGPCLRELPRVKKTYLEHHAKGLEILGVSCDTDVNELTAFLGKNKDMPWPQLFDGKENAKLQWHPIAKEWGISGIPTMFLIDKKGILRSVEARANFEEEIPKLLEEKVE